MVVVCCSVYGVFFLCFVAAVVVVAATAAVVGDGAVSIWKGLLRSPMQGATKLGFPKARSLRTATTMRRTPSKH